MKFLTFFLRKYTPEITLEKLLKVVQIIALLYVNSLLTIYDVKKCIYLVSKNDGIPSSRT